ncbi:MAG: glycoside hydrolase family 127 protein, partial [Chitinophagaceae bacterium]|nr:glycoside hydrolase family 127 protein [Chitinophagaceae bacterium]
MKKFNILFPLICLIVISCTTRQKTSESLELPREWKFQTGDNPEFSKPDFLDQEWKTINVDSYWETQGYAGYDGISWYRTKVVIPSSLKKNNTTLKTVRISLGQIDDVDEAYLNGKKIGETMGWDTQRTYLVPFDLIEWDKENTLSIRVSDMGGNGGMHGGIYSISNVRLSDIVILKTNDKPSEFKSSDLKFDKTLLFNFKVPVEKMEGTIHVKVYDAVSKAVLFKNEDHIVVGSKADSVYRISVQLKEPSTCKIDYLITSNALADTLKFSTLLAYNPATRANEHFEYPAIKYSVPGKIMPFELGNIEFGGYLYERLNANLTQRLLKIDETGILECYYNRPGKQTWVGEYTGKYLHAASRVWHSTHNAQLKTQMDRIVDILIGCQNEDGYL